MWLKCDEVIRSTGRTVLEALKFGLIFAVPTVMAVVTFIAAARADPRRLKS
jgi:hypothetical protein